MAIFKDDGEEEQVVVVPSVKEPLLAEEPAAETSPEPTPQPTPEPKPSKKDKKKNNKNKIEIQEVEETIAVQETVEETVVVEKVVAEENVAVKESQKIAKCPTHYPNKRTRPTGYLAY